MDNGSQKYGLFRPDGSSVCFYSDDVNDPSTIPKEAVKLTYRQWYDLISQQPYRRWNPLTNTVRDTTPAELKALVV